MLDNCEICGYDEVVGETGLCLSCLDLIEREDETSEEEHVVDDELDLVEMLNKNGVY
jgi:hypothetical protein